MKNTVKTLAILGLATSLYSCKPTEDPICVAGRTGNVTIVAYPQHHGRAVRPYKAYVRFNSKDAAASLSSYDYTKDADTTENHIELTNLKCGDYYIYLTGYDTAVKAVVKGGIPFSLAEGAIGEVNVNVPITE